MSIPTTELGEWAARYPLAGIPCYWVADAVNGMVIALGKPRVLGGVRSLGTVERLGAGDDLGLIVRDVVIGRIALADIF